jgi:selenide,water dikinase
VFESRSFPRLLVGLETGDDAAVYRVSDDFALIHTLDFFTPVVDDPFVYGAIAAANSMSDVYAMGGEVILALNICCFPPQLPSVMVSEIVRGGAEKVAEAGGVIAGGHTIDDKEPKYGLSVLGSVHPEKILTKGGGRPGDVLVLTKPLGTGVITTAAKADKARPEHLDAAVKSMLSLNRTASRLMRDAGVRACTDVTGFSLLGHAFQMAQAAGACLRFFADALPFVDGANGYAEEWIFPGGTYKNREYFGPHTRFDRSLSEQSQLLLFSPETSGGLLAAVPRENRQSLAQRCTEEGVECRIVGEIAEGEGVEVAGNVPAV